MADTLYLVRHPEVTANAQNAFAGVGAYPITASGKQQIRPVVEWFADREVRVVMSSPSPRCVALAKPLSARVGCEFHVCPELLEVPFGHWDGVPKATLEREDPRALERWDAAPLEVLKQLAPENEAIPERLKLLSHAAESLRTTPAVWVSHATLIRILTLFLIGEPLAGFRQVPCANASITVLGRTKQTWTVESSNLTPWSNENSL